MRTLKVLLWPAVMAFVLTMFIGVGSAAAVITPTQSANALAGALDRNGGVTGAALTEVPPNGNPTAVSDSDLALFPLDGPSYAVLSTGDATAAGDPDNSESTSSDNGSNPSNAGPGVYDQATLRVDFTVPAEANCLTFEYRFLTEEFDEYVGSEFNDGFLAELDDSNFILQDDGAVVAPNNFATGPDGDVTTVKEASTSADNALGTTYDGATAILRATTPVEPGPHSMYLSIYDVSDAVYDSTVFVDNMRLRQVPADKCKLGSADTPNEAKTCMGKEPTVFAGKGVATGTPGDDVILGTSGGDVIRGRGGNDTICALAGRDVVRGQGGADKIIGNKGRDDLRGNGGNDVIKGSRGLDVLSGQSGDDRVSGGKGNDRVYGGKDDDEVFGNAGDDRLYGRRGLDFLKGGDGDDNLRGGPDTDTCLGNDGADLKSGCEVGGSK